MLELSRIMKGRVELCGQLHTLWALGLAQSLTAQSMNKLESSRIMQGIRLCEISRSHTVGPWTGAVPVAVPLSLLPFIILDTPSAALRAQYRSNARSIKSHER